MKLRRGTFTTICRQAMHLCVLSQSKAWVDPDDVMRFTTVDSVATLAHVFNEDEGHSLAFWDIEGRRIPLLMRSTRLHELAQRSHS